MDDGTPNLEVGFTIDTGGAFAEILRFGQMFDDKTLQIIRQVADIEKATGGLMNLSAATARITTFGNEATRPLQTLANEAKKAERSGEGLIRQLDRQIAVVGKTREELRKLKVDEAVAAAERVKNFDLVQRLRAREVELYALEYAEMTKLKNKRKSDAEDAAAQADEDARMAGVQASALRDAGIAHQMFEARVREGAKAMRDQQAAATSDAAALARIREMLDPAAAAQDRLNAELKEAHRLLKQAGASTEELTRIDAIYAARLDEVRRAEEGHKRSLGATGGAAKLARHDLLNLSAQIQDVVVSLAGGQNPLMVFAQQGSQIGQIAASSGVSMGGMAKQALGLVAGLGAATLAITAVAAVAAVGAAAWLSYADALGKMQAMEQGAGRVIGVTGHELEANAQAAARTANITVGAAREIETSYVRMGGIGKDVLTGLTAMTNNFAHATGQDVSAAMQQLGTAFQDPVKGATDLTEKFGVLDQKTIQHIQSLVEANDKYGAQASLLDALGPAFEGAADHANILERAWHGIANAASNAWNAMGQAIDRALGGGSAIERIGDLYKQRDRLLTSTMGMGDTSFIDKQIAALRVSVQQTENAAARARSVGVMRDVGAITGNNALGGLKQRLSAVNDVLRDNGRSAGLSTAALKDARQAQDALKRAVETFLPTAEKQRQLAAVDAKMATARTPAAKAALAAQRERINLSGQVITSEQAESVAVSKSTSVLGEAGRAAESRASSLANAAARRAETLARESEAVEAQIRNLTALADAYTLSGGAALIAEARVKAESQAIKQRADIEAAVDRQVRLAIAQRVSDGAKATAGMREQVAAQAAVNAMVTAGLAPAWQAADLVREQIEDLPLLAAVQAAQQRGLTAEVKRATDALNDQRKARADLKAESATAQFNSAQAAAGDQLATLEKELALIGATDAARTHELATLRAMQEAKAAGYDPAQAEAYIAKQVEIADATERNRQAQESYNDALNFTAEKWDLIARNIQNAAGGMADAFGNVGRAIGDMATIYAGYQADRARLDLVHSEAIKKAGKDQAAIDRANQRFALNSATSQIGLFGDMTAAAKVFFSEKSKGYKALEAAEKAFRTIQFALSIRAMAQDVIETGSKIANSLARTAVAATEAVVNAIRSLPFPLNLAAGAATIAALASIGVGIAGSFGGGGSKPAPANDGTGTVLGDSEAKSESIKRSIDALKEVDTLTMNTSRAMLATLRSIDANIGGFASLLVRTGNIDASADVSQGFKANIVGSILGSVPIIGGILKGLFGTQTKVVGSGLFGGAQSIDEILGGGFDASYYSDVQKKKKFLGLTTSTKYNTSYTDADSEIENQFTLLLTQFYTAIGQAAGPLGQSLGDVERRLKGFVVDIGKIDLQGLTGAEIEEKLQAVFGAAADKMAQAAVPGLETFQAVGEGYYETLVRVASTVEVVTSTFALLGRETAGLGIGVNMAIAGAFESVSDFASKNEAYFETYYTQAEQAAAKSAQLGRTFASLGLTMPATLAGFRDLVEAQNLTTQAGQSTYATLLQLAPAFADLQAAMSGAKSAADILTERQDLERKLLELRGDTAALRALELAKIDPTNRALQQQIYAIEDAKAAAQAAEQLRDAWTSVGDSIMDEVKRIRGLTGTGEDGSFASLMGQFNAASTAARGGDQDAAKSLPGLSQALLKAAADAATSRQELERVQAQTAASLEATLSAIGGMTGSGASSAATLAAAATAAQATAAPIGANDDLASEVRALRDEVVHLRADNNAGHAANAANSGAMKRTLENVTAASGGEAISVTGVAA